MTRASRLGAALAFALLLPALAGCVDEAAPAAEAPASATLPDAALAEADAAQAMGGVGEHAHDLWLGRERATLLDQEVEVEVFEAPFWALATTYYVREPIAGGAFVSPSENATVYEGTGEIQFTATWSEATITGLRLTYTSPASTTPAPWIPLENGKATSIPVTPEMCDMAHAQFSKWIFIVAAAGTPSVAIGTFHVTAEIVKAREPAVMPAHPDLWQGRAELTLLDADGATPSGPEAALAEAQAPMDPPRHALAPSVVPMGTRTLHVRATNVVVGPGAPDPEILLRWTTAAQPVFFDREMQGTRDGDAWTWTIRVEMDETDSPYATESAWRFSLRARAADVDEMPLPCGDGCLDSAVSYHLTVVASQEPPS